MSPRKRTVPLLLLLLLLAPAPPAGSRAVQAPAAAVAGLSASLSAEVARAAQANGALGVHVVDLDTGEAVYAYNADEPRVLASNTKLLHHRGDPGRPGAGLLLRDPARAARRAPERRRAGRRPGRGRRRGPADLGPRVTAAIPSAPSAPGPPALRERGVRRVTGDLYLAHGLFESLKVHPDWPRDQLTRWYEAPVGRPLVQRQLHPGAGLAGQGGRAGAWSRPVPYAADLPGREHGAVTSSRRKGARLYVGRTEDVLIVRGSIDAGSGPVETWVTVPDPVRYFGGGAAGGAGRGGDRGRGGAAARGAAAGRGLGAGGRAPQRPGHRRSASPTSGARTSTPRASLKAWRRSAAATAPGATGRAPSASSSSRSASPGAPSRSPTARG